jgi:spore maturation protein CgeB
MKVLILDHYYQHFASAWYASHPGLAKATYAEQRQSLSTSLFGEAPFEVAALRAVGHDAAEIIVNDWVGQATWAKENGLGTYAPPGWGFRLRRGFVPWPTRQPQPRWASEVLLAQIRAFRPDVLHVQCMDSFPMGLIDEMRPYVRVIIGQVAAPIGIERVLEGYDFVVSSLPNFVDRFRKAGQDAEWLPLAFEPSVVKEIGSLARTVPVCFVGSVFSVHSSRRQFLDAIAEDIPLEIWTDNEATLPRESALRQHVHPPAWGREMYRVMASSKIAINAHIDIAENFANNLRLFEATGMGTLLVTDWKTNLGGLFEDGKEVVSYQGPKDCVEKVRYLLSNPEECSAIAEAGQRRTLRDHTWLDRMERLMTMAAARI